VTGQPLSDAEALMWRLGSHDARLRPVITVVAVLDASPGVDAVAERAAALVREVPRFAARVAPPVTPLSPPRLVPDDQFDPAAHVRVVAAPGDGTLDDVLALVGPLAGDGLDPSRPLWQMTLVEGMAGGRAALVVRVHHCLTDGMGALLLAAVLFGAPSDPGGASRAAPPGPGGVGSALSDLLADVRREADVSLAMVRAALPAAAGLLRAAVAPVPPDGEAGAVAGLLGSVARALAVDGRPASPVMTGRSASVVLGALEMDLGAVRTAGQAVGATVNDVFVAAVLDGFGRYHAKHGSRPEVLRLAVPIDLRDGEPADGDNHFFPARIMAPVAGGARERLAQVHELIGAARREPSVAAFAALASVAARLPAAEALAARALLAVDVVTSNVAGSPVPLGLAGVPVRQLLPFGPRSGAACNVTTVSYDGTLHVGVNVDPAAVPDAGTLLECLSDAFADAVIPA
jgi:diacylglycerol O-acyltransferase